MIKGVYFTFTTLTTIGFGDLVPKNNAEYIMSSIVMLSGVSVFSYAISRFLEVSEIFKKIEEEIGDDRLFALFFSTL